MARTMTTRGLVVVTVIAALSITAGHGGMTVSASASWPAKLESVLLRRAARTGTSFVIVRTRPGNALASVTAHARSIGGRVLRQLPIVEAVAVEVPNARIEAIAANPDVEHISVDRAVVGSMDRTNATVGADVVRQQLGFDGSGVGIAVIDSGVNAAHDDLAERDGRPSPVVRFVDFINGRNVAYDDYGHGTHIAGIVAGSGYDSGGARSGIAPG